MISFSQNQFFNERDELKVEKDRGITVKAQTCSLVYRCAKDGKDYLLNLIDVSYFYAIMVLSLELALYCVEYLPLDLADRLSFELRRSASIQSFHQAGASHQHQDIW